MVPLRPSPTTCWCLQRPRSPRCVPSPVYSLVFACDFPSIAYLRPVTNPSLSPLPPQLYRFWTETVPANIRSRYGACATEAEDAVVAELLRAVVAQERWLAHCLACLADLDPIARTAAEASAPEETSPAASLAATVHSPRQPRYVSGARVLDLVHAETFPRSGHGRDTTLVTGSHFSREIWESMAMIGVSFGGGPASGTGGDGDVDEKTGAIGSGSDGGRASPGAAASLLAEPLATPGTLDRLKTLLADGALDHPAAGALPARVLESLRRRVPSLESLSKEVREKLQDSQASAHLAVGDLAAAIPRAGFEHLAHSFQRALRRNFGSPLIVVDASSSPFVEAALRRTAILLLGEGAIPSAPAGETVPAAVRARVFAALGIVTTSAFAHRWLFTRLALLESIAALRAGLASARLRYVNARLVWWRVFHGCDTVWAAGASKEPRTRLSSRAENMTVTAQRLQQWGQAEAGQSVFSKGVTYNLHASNIHYPTSLWRQTDIGGALHVPAVWNLPSSDHVLAGRGITVYTDDDAYSAPYSAPIACGAGAGDNSAAAAAGLSVSQRYLLLRSDVAVRGLLRDAAARRLSPADASLADLPLEPGSALGQGRSSVSSSSSSSSSVGATAGGSHEEAAGTTVERDYFDAWDADQRDQMASFQLDGGLADAPEAVRALALLQARVREDRTRLSDMTSSSSTLSPAPAAAKATKTVRADDHPDPMAFSIREGDEAAGTCAGMLGLGIITPAYTAFVRAAAASLVSAAADAHAVSETCAVRLPWLFPTGPIAVEKQEEAHTALAARAGSASEGTVGFAPRLWLIPHYAAEYVCRYADICREQDSVVAGELACGSRAAFETPLLASARVWRAAWLAHSGQLRGCKGSAALVGDLLRAVGFEPLPADALPSLENLRRHVAK